MIFGNFCWNKKHRWLDVLYVSYFEFALINGNYMLNHIWPIFGNMCWKKRIIVVLMYMFLFRVRAKEKINFCSTRPVSNAAVFSLTFTPPRLSFVNCWICLNFYRIIICIFNKKVVTLRRFFKKGNKTK